MKKVYVLMKREYCGDYVDVLAVYTNEGKVLEEIKKLRYDDYYRYFYNIVELIDDDID